MAPRKAGIGAKLERAAVDLYAERRSLQITAAEIAARAGTTERTFFRHFPDKLDVFFGDETRLIALVTDAIAACPPERSVLGAAVTGLAALAADFEAHREDIARRARTVAAHPELEARELARTASWIARIRDALLRRGASGEAAQRVAPVALFSFRVAYDQWVAEPGAGPFEHRLLGTVAALRQDFAHAGDELIDADSLLSS